jgi:peptidoglycan lytic transglycosylase G
MIGRLLRTLAILLLLLVLAGGGVAWWAWEQLHAPFRAEGRGPVTVEVAPGASARAILDQLERRGVLKNAALARLYLVHQMGSPLLKAGEYRFDKPLTTPEVLGLLARGQVVTYPLTVIEGLSQFEVADVIARAGFGDTEALLVQMQRRELIADLDPEASNLEGYLYPDTYHFVRGASASEVVETLVRTFRRRFDAEVEPVFTPREDFGLRSLVTLASIVEKETQLDEERQLVASVYANRLRIGMGLYADPTIIYAKKLGGTWDGNLRRVDLKLDSPYNTYRYPGLPPGPICSPSVASLLAAAMPADTNYLYFVSRNDGRHVFASSKEEHDRNVYKWQKLYWKERWAKERAEKESGS